MIYQNYSRARRVIIVRINFIIKKTGSYDFSGFWQAFCSFRKQHLARLLGLKEKIRLGPGGIEKKIRFASAKWKLCGIRIAFESLKLILTLTLSSSRPESAEALGGGFYRPRFFF